MYHKNNIYTYIYKAHYSELTYFNKPANYIYSI